MADGAFTIENIMPSASPYRSNGNGEDGSHYVECLQSEEANRAAWLEKIKISSAENYKAGFLAGSNSHGDLGGKVDAEEDVRLRLFETIPAPCKSMNSNTFQRVRITDFEEEDDIDTKDACTRLKNCMDLREKWLAVHPAPPQDLLSTFLPSEMVTASAARAIKGDIEKDLPSNCSYKDLNQTPAEIASNILHKRERDNAESLSMLNLNELEKNRTKSSCLSESDETEERDDCNKSPSKILHPDDYRRRLIPFANIFNKPLPVFLPPPSDDELEIINNERAANLGVEVSNNGYHSNYKNNGNIGNNGNNGNGIGNGTGSVHGDSSINTSHDSADSSAMLSETVNEDPDRRLNEIINQASHDKKSKITMPVIRYYPTLKWVMKAGVMHVFQVTPTQTKHSNQSYAIESKEKNEDKQNLKELDLTGILDHEINKELQVNLFPVLTFSEFVKDFNYVKQTVFSGPCTSYAFIRLELLSAKFNLHILLNGTRELNASKSVPHRDFYNVRKVDTHVHHSACMNQKHLLRFIKHKLRHVPHEIVTFRDGKYLTLGEVFESLKLTAYDLSIDTLDMHAHDTFHRFDRFNLKYNPAGQSRLREIFLKTENHIGGRYLAEMTREVMGDLEASKYQLAEWRVSIYGRKACEWSQLAAWFFEFKLAHENVRWLIQIPRLYHIYREAGDVSSFAEMLDNIFSPLFAVSIDPSCDPALHYFLETIVGLDSVDDESRPEKSHLSGGAAGNLPEPEQWTSSECPPYAYWMYYTHANLCVLNKLRADRGLNTFQFRPHCGEAGDLDHLVATYLVAHQINHGILLRKNTSLQYLYYLSQVGIAMSPLSNNKLFLDFHKNPFPKYFSQGMNVSLSTDDPLMLHYTKDPLVEEYSVATQVWKLSATDQCEIARMSVLQSGWAKKYKLHFLGENYSDIRETNVPNIRLIYRKETLETEITALNKHSFQVL